MSTNSKIEWCEATWNPVTGCTKYSAGCANCYAAVMSRRLQAMGQQKYAHGFTVALHEAELNKPLTWRKHGRVFVNSMSDTFHADVPTEFIQRMFDVMRQAHWHQFLVLTKRAERLLELDPLLPWAPNIWAGVTVENADYLDRIDALREISAQMKFLSLEPLLGPLPNLDLTGINWAIVGGESGPGARPMEAEWVRDLRDQCLAADVRFHFKQYSGTRPKALGRLLDGRTWDESPAILDGGK